MRVLLSLFMALMVGTGAFARDAETLKPYVLARAATGTVAAQVEIVAAQLAAHGFEVVGRYAPYDGAEILVVTSAALKAAAAGSELGGYGAALHVSVTAVDDELQVAYTCPPYMANAYRMGESLAAVAAGMEAALGREHGFGSRKGLRPAKLRKYHYTLMMPHFDDQDELATYPTHAQAVAAVEAGLERGAGGTRKICRIAIPGKEETLFCVGLREGSGRDEAVMGNCDREALKSTPYLPYEMLVSGGRVLALPGKFRIAVSFPDLSMGTFMKIARAPGGIKAALKAAAQGS